MNIAIYLDNHVARDRYLPLVERCINSAREHMPGARILHLTTTTGPLVSGADERIEVQDEGPFLYRRCTAQAKVQGETLFADADAVFMADVSNVFEMNFDIAVAKSATPVHPWLACSGGVVFSRAPHFFQALATIGKGCDWPKSEPSAWVPVQLAYNWLLTSDSFKVYYLPAAIYEYRPRDENDDCAGVRIAHYKGKRRKDWKVPLPSYLAKPVRITPEYLALQKAMHADRAVNDYGNMGSKWAPIVEKLAGKMVLTSILDYGCGPGGLAKALPELPVREYDPCVEGKDAEPEPADLLVCTDMLEHAEPQCVEAVLDHMRALTARTAFLAIYIGPAQKNLPDGRNAHLIQQPPSWWIERINRRWNILRAEVGGNHLVVVANGDKVDPL